MTSHAVKRSARAVLACLGMGFAATAANAQCTPHWIPTTGTDYPITTMTVLANGDIVVAGGQGSVATFDDMGHVSGFSQLGAGLGTIEGVPVHYVARWNGSSWSSLGSGLADPPDHWIGTGLRYPVNTLVQTSNGQILVGGIDFALSSGGPKDCIGSFDGTSWSEFSPSIVPASVFSPFGTLNSEGLVEAIAQLPNGDLVAGGLFFLDRNATAFDDAGHYLMRWDGTQWTDLAAPGGLGENDICRAMASLPDGTLIVGGYPNTPMNGISGANHIAEWDGVSMLDGLPDWTPMNQGVGGGVEAILPLPDGDIIVAGQFTYAGNATENDVPASRIVRWDHTNHLWVPMGVGLNNDVYALARMPNGDIIAGGLFTAAGNVTDSDTPAFRIARWDVASSMWVSMDGGLDTNVTDTGTIQHEQVNALVVTSDGTLWVGGDFATVGSAQTPSPFFARWGCAAAAPGICCRGCICDSSLTTQAACNAATNPPALWSSLGSTCNTSGNYSSPCCAADYDKSNTVNVSDIFAFLRGWFGHSSFADANQSGGTPDVSDIFYFLRAWFSTNGHCSTS